MRRAIDRSVALRAGVRDAPRRLPGAAFVLLTALLAVYTAAGTSSEEAAGDPEPRELVATADERGSFSTPCAYSHSGPDDPIVHPGHGGVSHRHDFFGATTTDASSDARSLLAGGTNCRSVADHSAYWAPSVLDGGRQVEPVEMLAYYRVPVGADARLVESPPNGLEMIAGDPRATGPQDPSRVGWACGLAAAMSPVPQRCPPGAELRLLLRFDPCWDGENLRSPDHVSHLAPLGDGGACPSSHPVLLPEVTLEIRYRTGGEGGVRPTSSAAGGGLTLASGPATGGHGDVLVAWDEQHIATEVEVCLRANRRCDVVSESARLGFDQLAE